MILVLGVPIQSPIVFLKFKIQGLSSRVLSAKPSFAKRFLVLNPWGNCYAHGTTNFSNFVNWKTDRDLTFIPCAFVPIRGLVEFFIKDVKKFCWLTSNRETNLTGVFIINLIIIKSIVNFYYTRKFMLRYLEGDELYTKVGQNKPPSESEGWTIVLMDRASRFRKGFELWWKGNDSLWKRYGYISSSHWKNRWFIFDNRWRTSLW